MTLPWPAAYVGLPFGEGEGQVTCWSLVARVYRDLLGIALPAYGEIPARDLLQVARAMRAGAAAVETWRPVSPPREFDVVIMRGPRGGIAVVHVGVMTGDGRMLHVEAASAAVVVPITHWSVAGRILGWRRYLCRS